MSSPLKLSNNAIGRLAGNISGSATAINLQTGQGALFPVLGVGEYFNATIVRASDSAIEIVRVTARSSDSLTVTRAQETTSGLAFLAGDRIELRMTAGTFTDEIARVEGKADAALPRTGGVMTGDFEMGAGTKIVMEGTSADAFEVSIVPGDPTADRTLTLPDKSGTIATLGDLGDARTMTGDLTMSAASFIGTKGATVPSASTTSIFAATDGNEVDISGSVTITSLGTAPQAGYKVSGTFSGSPQITAGANLILNNGAANIQAAPGDTFVATAQTTTQHAMVVTKKSGSAVAGPSYSASGTSITTTGGALTNAAVGRTTDASSSTPTTTSLPALSTLSDGNSFSLVNVNTGAATFTTVGGDTIYGGNLGGVSSFVLSPGENVILSKSGSTYRISSSNVKFFGAAQTWQDVTASRAVSTMYTNNSGREKYVSGYCTNTGAGILAFQVAGFTRWVFAAASGVVQMPFTCRVPDGSSYQLVLVSGSFTLTNWNEG